ncbi:hypothetical protein CLF_112333 [Clonorchis sinensis]|uniref:Endonuclease/exonuclease/phosphatase domain-containing protein n=1 Tax=Clonorchis sinensis TaxID=79923 RepID=G7YW79_CLOSI|nr:hypothetical protein CLF_112333 [Clonorchis sinensis]
MNLSMLLFIARSQLPKVHNLRAIIAIARQNLICVTKIWLSVETPDTAVSSPGYNIHRPDRKTSRNEGCTIYSTSELRTAPTGNSSLEGIPEAVWVSIEQTERQVPAGCYYQPPAPYPAPIADFYRIISTAHALPHSFTFVLGDFNLLDSSWPPILGPTR